MNPLTAIYKVAHSKTTYKVCGVKSNNLYISVELLSF